MYIAHILEVAGILFFLFGGYAFMVFSFFLDNEGEKATSTICFGVGFFWQLIVEIILLASLAK